jgi:hypothetical protein
VIIAEEVALLLGLLDVRLSTDLESSDYFLSYDAAVSTAGARASCALCECQ